MKSTKTARAPKGFRFLKATEKIKAGDRFSYSGFDGWYDQPGVEVYDSGAIKIGVNLKQAAITYTGFMAGPFTGQVIRRLPAKKKTPRPATRKGGKRK